MKKTIGPQTLLRTRTFKAPEVNIRNIRFKVHSSAYIAVTLPDNKTIYIKKQSGIRLARWLNEECTK